jgi:hypothetical protein
MVYALRHDPKKGVAMDTLELLKLDRRKVKQLFDEAKSLEAGKEQTHVFRQRA